MSRPIDADFRVPRHPWWWYVLLALITLLAPLIRPAPLY